MKMYRFYISFLTLILVAFASCKKQDSPPQFHYDYFDLTEGRFIDYDVMEIDHDVDQSIQHDTSYYQLRTLIGDTVIDNQGRVARKFFRYTRDNSAGTWMLSDVWTALITENRAELIEENQRIIKLVFAPTLSKEWNPNAFNIYDEMTSYYRDIHDVQTVGGFLFDSALVVEQEDFFSLIDKKRKYEVYAKGVGLVHKYYKDLTIANFDTLNVQKGKELYYTCFAYGIQ
jgi:hypothetical protein